MKQLFLIAVKSTPISIAKQCRNDKNYEKGHAKGKTDILIHIKLSIFMKSDSVCHKMYF